MQKKWSNPEIKNLGIENTRTEICSECGCLESEDAVMLAIADDTICYAKRGGSHGKPNGCKPACSGKVHASGCGKY